MNPPYSKPEPWADKFIQNGNGIALVPATRGKWFARLWDKSDSVMPTPYNFTFESPKGKLPISYLTFLFAMGEQSVKALEKLELARVRK